MRHKPFSNLTILDDYGDPHNYYIDVVEEKQDTNLGNFTGLFDKEGRPLFRPKQKIGFRVDRF